MPKTILVPTDGSDHAKKAVALAGDLAKLRGARLRLLHVLLRDKEPRELRRLAVVASLDAELQGALEQAEKAPCAPSVPDWAPFMDPASVPSNVPGPVLKAIGEAVLDQAAHAARAEGVEDIALELEDGAAVEVILSVAARDKADAIVMGHRGLRDIDAITFGSVSNKVSRLATCDVVMIK